MSLLRSRGMCSLGLREREPDELVLAIDATHMPLYGARRLDAKAASWFDWAFDADSAAPS